MDNIKWEPILWTNDGVYMSATKTSKAVRDCVRCQAGEALRFDLYTFYKNNGALVGTVTENLHWSYRGNSDDKHFLKNLNKEHEDHPKAKFRVMGYRATVEKEDC